MEWSHRAYLSTYAFLQWCDAADMIMNLSIEDSIYGKIDWFFHPVTQTVKPYTLKSTQSLSH